jgi:hypothetical protein
MLVGSCARADSHAHAHPQTRIQKKMCVCERTSCACAKQQANRSCVHGALPSPAVHDESTTAHHPAAHHESTTAHHLAEHDERESQHATQQCITRHTWLIWFTRICWCMRRSPCLSYETAFDGSGFAPSYSTCHDRATVLRRRRS